MRINRFLATSLGVFVLVGVATTMLGPLLPVLASQYKLTDGQSGLLFVAQFCGGFLGAIASTKLIQRTSAHVTMRAGLLLMALGVACVPCSSLWAVACGITLYGLGIGFATPAVSVSVCEALPAHRASALNLLNLFWALGAIAAPGIISQLVLRTTLGLRGTLSLAAAALGIAAFVIPSVEVAVPTKQNSDVSLGARDLRLILITGLLIFIYVGLENGVAGWLPTFVQRLAGFTPESGAQLQGTFWAALLTGRLLSAIWIQRGREHFLLIIAMATVTFGTVLLLVSQVHFLLYISVLLIGAGCSPIFPTAIAVLSQQLSGNSSQKLGWMFAAGGLGGAALPFCIGAISGATTSLRMGMSILLIAEVGMMLTHAAMRQSCSETVLPAYSDPL